jgi:peptidoglycan LD-endopeptidase CwlK
MASRSVWDLHPRLRELAHAHAAKCAVEGITLLIYCTWRSNEEQAELYAKGRTAPGRKVTNARPGESLHNHTANGTPAAYAYDAAPLVGGKLDWQFGPEWQRMGELGESLGLEWGGRWGKLADNPHFQLPAELRD